MESKNIEDIKTAVRILLDENSTQNALLSSNTDNLELNQIIEKSILPAVQFVHMNAPLKMVDGKNQSLTPTSGVAKLPTDYMRMVSAKFPSWSRSVHEAVDEADPRCSALLSGYAGLSGTENNPVVILYKRNDGMYIHAIPSPTGASTISLNYLPIPEIKSVTQSGTTVQAVDIEPRCYQAILYYIASLVSASLNVQSSFGEVAKSLLE